MRALAPYSGNASLPTSISEEDWNSALTELAELGLISLDSGPGVDAHPLVREYFGRQIRKQAPDAWRAAHRRLYEHLCEKTEHHPDTIPGLQPLYQAVAHGCQAGLQQEACDSVYIDRILRGMGNDGFYSSRKLGAIGADLGAVACFFERPWSRLSENLSPPARAWLLNQAAFSLRALGRLTEAVEPMRAGAEMCIEREDWIRAAGVASNLSELELTLGDVSAAVTDGRQSVTFADRSGDAFLRMGSRTTHADALHQAGRREESLRLFREAEQIQAELQPEYPRFYSVRGFRYCDLLAADAQRTSWRVFLLSGGSAEAHDPGGRETPPEAVSAGPADLEACAAACDEIAERGSMQLYLADVHLTRARLFRDRTALETARHLIDRHAYARRAEELADAEAALGV